MLRKHVRLKTTVLLVFFLWLIKSFEKLLKKSLVDHLQICDLFSNFHYDVKSSCSTADLLTAASDRIVMAFNDLGLLKL